MRFLVVLLILLGLLLPSASPASISREGLSPISQEGLSPDKLKRCLISADSDSPRPRFVIVDTASGEAEYFEQDVPLSGADYAEWIDNIRVAMVGHINPDLNVYIILDTVTKEITYNYGIGFVWDKDATHLYYILPRPHFGAGGVDKIVRDTDDNVLYVAGEGEHITEPLSFSADETKICFYAAEDDSPETRLNELDIK